MIINVPWENNSKHFSAKLWNFSDWLVIFSLNAFIVMAAKIIRVCKLIMYVNVICFLVAIIIL